MSKVITNFFGMAVTPIIKNLYETEIRTRRWASEPDDNVIVRKTKDSVISMYPLPASRPIEPQAIHIEWLVRSLLFRQIDRAGDFFDVDEQDSEFSILNERLVQRTEYSILRRIVFRVFHATGRLFLAIDPITRLYNRITLAKLLSSFGFEQGEFLEHPGCLVFVEHQGSRKWVYGRIREIVPGGTAKIEVRRILDGTIEVGSSRVIPTLNKAIIASIAKRNNSNIDFDRELKRFGDQTSEAKLRAVQELFLKHLNPLFPLRVKDTVITVTPAPVPAEGFKFDQIRAADEPDYVITREHVTEVRSAQRLPGLSRVNITTGPKEHRVVLVAPEKGMRVLTTLVSQLNAGVQEGGYSFSMPSKFGVRLAISDKLEASDYLAYDHLTDVLVNSSEDKHRDALVLIHLPANSDRYYPLKAKLAFHGKVSQFVSSPALNIHGLWNIATNIFAKLGYKPWGIAESTEIPHADMVLGFAYSSLRSEGRNKRNVAFVNVFDRHGVWQFVQSASGYLDFDKRLKVIPSMIRSATLGFLASGTTPSIIDIHYSKRFSFDERCSTVEVLRGLVPALKQVNFVSLDKTHPLRLFDSSTNNQNFLRGGIMHLNEREFLMSIAGSNKPGSLASRLLKVRVWQDPLEADPDVHAIAYRVLAMSKLNWRSAVRETSEPVTLRFAEEIANLTNHFSLTEWNMVSNQLAHVPWFI